MCHVILCHASEDERWPFRRRLEREESTLAGCALVSAVHIFDHCSTRYLEDILQQEASCAPGAWKPFAHCHAGVDGGCTNESHYGSPTTRQREVLGAALGTGVVESRFATRCGWQQARRRGGRWRQPDTYLYYPSAERPQVCDEPAQMRGIAHGPGASLRDPKLFSQAFEA